MNNALRLPIAAFLGLVVTMVVFWFLWETVSGHHGFAVLKPAVKIDFTPLRHDTETETKREKVQQQKPEKMPEIPLLTSSSSNLSSDNNIGSVLPTFDRAGMGNISIGADRDVVPLVRINPEYPTRARERGIEGWVQVEFTITAAGTVADAKVVDADPKGLFERAALEAIGRWKYNPKVVDGRAMERRGVQVVLTFKLEK
jgi:protein TonB